MTGRRIVSPMFLDRPAEAPLQLSRPGDMVIAARPGEGEQIERVAPIHRALADTVSHVASAGLRPIAILGDCCQVIPMMAGLERSGISPALIWLDSHGDFNTWETTPSGFLGGMPLAMLTGRGDQRMMQAVGLFPIADARVVLSDARDLDPGEKVLVAEAGIAHAAKLEEVLAALPEGPLYVHYDSDILDSAVAPAFLYAVPGGPAPPAINALLAALEATGRVIAFSACAAWDASRDAGRKTEAAVKQSLAGVFTY